MTPLMDMNTRQQYPMDTGINYLKNRLYEQDDTVRNKWSGRRDSNPRPSPWQGDALPLSHVRVDVKNTNTHADWGSVTATNEKDLPLLHDIRGNLSFSRRYSPALSNNRCKRTKNESAAHHLDSIEILVVHNPCAEGT